MKVQLLCFFIKGTEILKSMNLAAIEHPQKGSSHHGVVCVQCLN